MTELVPVCAAIPEVPVARMFSHRLGVREVFLFPNPVAFWVHWTNKRSLPCVGKFCPRDRHRKPVQLIAYYPGCYLGQERRQDRFAGVWVSTVFQAGIETKCRVDKVQAAGMLVKVKLEIVPGKVKLLPVEFTAVKKTPSQPGDFCILPTLFRSWGLRYDPITIRDALAASLGLDAKNGEEVCNGQ